MGHALSAVGAACAFQRAVIGYIHSRPGTGAGNVPDVHSLDFITDLDTPHALDAFAGLPDDRSRQIHM